MELESRSRNHGRGIMEEETWERNLEEETGRRSHGRGIIWSHLGGGIWEASGEHLGPLGKHLGFFALYADDSP